MDAGFIGFRNFRSFKRLQIFFPDLFLQGVLLHKVFRALEVDKSRPVTLHFRSYV